MATLSQPTLTELITEIRSNLNEPSSTNSFWSDAEITYYVNRAIRRYFTEVVINMEGQFVTTTDLNIVTNTETIALPSDFFKVRALYKKINQGYSICHYRNILSSGYSLNGGANGDQYIPFYYIRGQNIVLRPIPNFSETGGLKLEYVQFPETMVSGGDSMTAEVSPVFRDLIIAYCTWQAKVKQSLVAGTDMASIAKDHLTDQYLAFKDVVVSRSANPTAIIPFNPEAE